MRFRTKRRKEPSVEITPLIDVVFLLLLFFMVTTQFISLPGIKLTLPDIKPGKSVTATAKIEIQVTTAGDLYVAGNPVAEPDLGEAIKNEAQDLESAVVVLMADKNVTHGRIVGILDILRAYGLKRVVLAARWKPDDKPD